MVIDEGSLRDTLAAVAAAHEKPLALVDTLHDVVEGASRVFGVTGASVSMPDDRGRLRFVTAATEAVASVEVVQERAQQGPCLDAVHSGQPVPVADLRTEAQRWPQVAAAADRAGIVSTAAIPMHLNDADVGVFSLCDTSAHEWHERQLEVAQLLADLTAGYVVSFSGYQQATTVVDQLQHALDSRVLIEQAKGVLAGERNISVDEAFRLLRQHARNNNARLHDVAYAVVNRGLRP